MMQLHGSRWGSVLLGGASVGYSAGLGLPSLLVSLWLSNSGISIYKNLLPPVLLFAYWIFFTDAYGYVYLIGYSIALFIISKSVMVAVSDRLLNGLFWFQIFLFVFVGAFFDYGPGGWSAGGYSIVNDFCLQLFLLQLVIAKNNRGLLNTVRWMLVLMVSIINSAELIFLVSLCGMMNWSREKLSVSLFLALIATYPFYDEIVNSLSFVVSMIFSALDGECYGSKCFRIFALGLASSEFIDSYFVGLSPGGVSMALVEARENGAGIVMAGSLHNVFFEYLIDTGWFGLLLLIFAVYPSKISIFRLALVIASLFSSGGSILYSGCIFFLVGQAIRRS